MATAVDVRPASAVARMTADEFFHHPLANGPAELVRGEVRILSPTAGPHGRIARNVFRPLDAYVESHRLGEVFFDGTGFALPPRNDTMRSPDVAFVRAGRLPADALPEGWVPVAPDLVVEVLSPSESHSDVMEKLDDYFAGGTALAWVVDPRRRGVEVHAADRTMRWVSADAVLDGAPVLPEFHLPVAAVFTGATPAP